MLKHLLLVLLFGLSTQSGISQSNCNSTFSVIENPKNQSLQIEIKTNGNYICTLYVVENGTYVEVESIDGYNASTQKIENLSRNKVYLVKVEFFIEEGVCRTRKLGGITF
ncbi:MAG TPA: hypothetical protein PKL31_16530 [Fulvivirga sp.]|nr:hypothetical protein [Fulvivirga sp.]